MSAHNLPYELSRIPSTETVELQCAISLGGASLGFFGTDPVAQRSAYTQTYSTADRTHADLTSADFTYPASGNMFDAVAADLLINVRTDSAANVAADCVTNLKSIAANNNQLRADLIDLKQLVNSIIDDLQALGLCAS